jgi:hypothetical protein
MYMYIIVTTRPCEFAWHKMPEKEFCQESIQPTMTHISTFLTRSKVSIMSRHSSQCCRTAANARQRPPAGPVWVGGWGEGGGQEVSGKMLYALL